jgi:Amt family ammonium transporter
MNNELKESNPAGVFVTSIVGRYNLKTDIVELANAGHQPALVINNNQFKEYTSNSMPLAVVKHKDESAYKLEKFSLNKGRIYCFTDGFSECQDENKNEIGIDGVKKLILKHQNPSLQKELENATEEIRLKSLKINSKESGIKEDNEILDDDLTIIGIGK